MKKLRILAFVDYYLPGYKGGGPLVSVSRLASAMERSADFFVFTRDRDLGDESAYEGVATDRWTERGGTRVLYASPHRRGAGAVLRAVRTCRPDVVYLNSFFSRMTVTVLLLRRLGLLRRVGVVLAPRGEFSKGALAIKPLKKQAFIALSKAVGLYGGVLWKPSASQEREDIKAVFRRASCVTLAEIPARPRAVHGETKATGACRFVFLSRVSRKKNLEFALEALRAARGDVEFDVYGPMESAEYEQSLRRAADRLPSNIRVRFMGPIAPAQVPGALGAAHFFLFPTLGENFGHVIAESLAVGLPCLLSDTTPWSDVELSGAGWAVPLDARSEWVERIQACVDMGEEEYAAMRQNVKDYYLEWLGSNACQDADQVFHLGSLAA